jgi:hypothetical protein
MGEMSDRMLRGELYIAEDPDLASEYARAQELIDRTTRTVTPSRICEIDSELADRCRSGRDRKR